MDSEIFAVEKSVDNLNTEDNKELQRIDVTVFSGIKRKETTFS